MTMTNVFQYGFECGTFVSHTGELELPPVFELFAKRPGASLPGQGQPDREWLVAVVLYPVTLLERLRQMVASLCRSLENMAFGSGGGAIVPRAADQAQPRELLERIIDLRPRHRRPFPNLALFQCYVYVITMHWPLGQQAQNYQVRYRRFHRTGY